MSKRASEAVSESACESACKSSRVSRTGRMCGCGEAKVEIESNFCAACLKDGYSDRVGELCAHCKNKSDDFVCNISTRRCEVCCLPVCEVECGRGYIGAWTCGTQGGMQCDAPLLCLGLGGEVPPDIACCFKCKVLFCELHTKGLNCGNCDKYCCEVCAKIVKEGDCCEGYESDDSSTLCDEEDEEEEDSEEDEKEYEDKEDGEQDL